MTCEFSSCPGGAPPTLGSVWTPGNLEIVFPVFLRAGKHTPEGYGGSLLSRAVPPEAVGIRDIYKQWIDRTCIQFNCTTSRNGMGIDVCRGSLGLSDIKPVTTRNVCEHTYMCAQAYVPSSCLIMSVPCIQ